MYYIINFITLLPQSKHVLFIFFFIAQRAVNLTDFFYGHITSCWTFSLLSLEAINFIMGCIYFGFTLLVLDGVDLEIRAITDGSIMDP